MKAKVDEIEEQIVENQKQRRIKALLMLITFIMLISVISIVSFKTTKKIIANNNSNSTKITITADGFSPSTLIVKSGTTVVWVNQSASPQKLGAIPFPTHASLSGLYTKQPIAPHASYSYTFHKQGTWQYSDYNQPTVNGTVIVQ